MTTRHRFPFLLIAGLTLSTFAHSQTRDEIIAEQDELKTFPTCASLPAEKKTEGQDKDKDKEKKSSPQKATFYDDSNGPKAQPPHVVFNPSTNGTARAHLPDGKEPPFKACVVHKPCEICFEDRKDCRKEKDADKMACAEFNRQNCMAARYEGDGPDTGRFDFNVPFVKKNCGRKDLPKLFTNECAAINKTIAKLKSGTNCFAKPQSAACKNIMATAKAGKESDRAAYNECKALYRKASEDALSEKCKGQYERGGEHALDHDCGDQFEKDGKKGVAEFNTKHPGDNERRRIRCDYSDLRYLIRTKKGDTECTVSWSLLMPASCPEGSYVGNKGLDCCSKDVTAAAAVGSCAVYFPQEKAQPATPNTPAVN